MATGRSAASKLFTISCHVILTSTVREFPRAASIPGEHAEHAPRRPGLRLCFPLDEHPCPPRVARGHAMSRPRLSDLWKTGAERSRIRSAVCPSQSRFSCDRALRRPLFDGGQSDGREGVRRRRVSRPLGLRRRSRPGRDFSPASSASTATRRPISRTSPGRWATPRPRARAICSTTLGRHVERRRKEPHQHRRRSAVLGRHGVERPGLDRLGTRRRHDQHRPDLRLLSGPLDRRRRPDAVRLGLVVRRRQRQPRLERLGAGRRPGGGFYPAENFADYFHSQSNDSLALGAIDQYLHSGYGVTLGIYGPRRTRDHRAGDTTTIPTTRRVPRPLDHRLRRQQERRRRPRPASLLRGRVRRRPVVSPGLLRQQRLVHRHGSGP